MKTLREHLDYEPVPLQFGTSGRRGLVVHLTQLEVYLNALAEVHYLQSLPASAGGVVAGQEFYFATDLRPSSTQFAPAEQDRGELAQAIAAAMAAAGLKPVFLGSLPTPALASYALERRRGSMMVTGSHIPFDRNGYKTNTARGELLKKDEAPIQRRVDEVRRQLYATPFAESPFNHRGMFKHGHRQLPAPEADAAGAYLRRYADFFRGATLRGQRLLVYQHSAVGRDLLAELLKRLGAEVICAGRSEVFVPIDTENIDQAQLEFVQALAVEAWRSHGPIDAVVSTDGDSDRPLILGVEPLAGPVPCQVRFYGGDLVGMVVAQFLGADAIVVPISCNDAIDRGALRTVLEPKTRIGSPFVIAGMEQALAKGRLAVCGWEANGGFLTGSDLQRGGAMLSALPTRDAFLPILGVLFAAAGQSLSSVFSRLPARFSRAALLKNFPRPASLRIVRAFSPTEDCIKEASFEGDRVILHGEAGNELASTAGSEGELKAIRSGLVRFFKPTSGFGSLARINYVDGVRLCFDNGDVAHFRPSGNADELRIYAVADTQERAEAIAKLGVADPGGILRQLETATPADQAQKRHY